METSGKMHLYNNNISNGRTGNKSQTLNRNPITLVSGRRSIELLRYIIINLYVYSKRLRLAENNILDPIRLDSFQI